MDWPLSRGGSRFATLGADAASTSPATINPTPAHTKSTWLELSAATPFHASGFILQHSGGSAGEPSFLDIGIGAAAAEVVILPNVITDTRRPANWVVSCYYPIPIAVGSRVAMRGQVAVASDPITVIMTLVGGGFWSDDPLLGASAEVLNLDFTTTRILNSPTAAANNVKGGWVELIAATAFSSRWAVFYMTNRNRAAISGAFYRLDIGIGAAASEVVLIPDVSANSTTGTDVISNTLLGPFWVPIPEGSRLAYRYQASFGHSSAEIGVSGHLLS